MSWNEESDLDLPVGSAAGDVPNMESLAHSAPNASTHPQKEATRRIEVGRGVRGDEVAPG